MMTITSSSNNNNHSAPVPLVPPHLDGSPWLMFEQQAALVIYDDLNRTIRRLAKKPSADRVHEARVALRRWDCIWNILKEDGWLSKKYWKQVGKELKKIRRMLGEIRDCDVNLELTEHLDVPQEIIEHWLNERKSIARKTKKRLKSLDVEKLLDRMGQFLLTRPEKLRHQLESNGASGTDSAYEHLEPFIKAQEEIARNLASTANSPEELHALRLGIKAWRYLLAEFYGLTNLQLVRAQQILGKLNDLHRVEVLLTATESPLAKDSLSKCNEQREKLLDDFTQFRESLPYGLRPSITSVSEKLKTN
jgi:CHAD domain-containing protein